MNWLSKFTADFVEPHAEASLRLSVIISVAIFADVAGFRLGTFAKS